MARLRYKVPRSLRGRIAEVARRHGFASARAAADHFVLRGLRAYGAGEPETRFAEAVHEVVEAQGYATGDELIEHLLLRGLLAYEEAAADPAQLEERLRGLGYID